MPCKHNANTVLYLRCITTVFNGTFSVALALDLSFSLELSEALDLTFSVILTLMPILRIAIVDMRGSADCVCNQSEPKWKSMVEAVWKTGCVGP